jgi:hypothetical protein
MMMLPKMAFREFFNEIGTGRTLAEGWRSGGKLTYTSHAVRPS